MNNGDDVTRRLASIDRRLALLTAPQERDLRRTLVEKLLTTGGRVAMFDGLNGQHGSAELAKLGGVGERSAQLFVKELLDMGLVRPVGGTGGRTMIVERDDDAIVQWYLQQQSEGRS